MGILGPIVRIDLTGMIRRRRDELEPALGVLQDVADRDYRSFSIGQALGKRDRVRLLVAVTPAATPESRPPGHERSWPARQKKKRADNGERHSRGRVQIFRDAYKYPLIGPIGRR